MHVILGMGCDGRYGTDFLIKSDKPWNCYLLLYVKSFAIFYCNGKEIHTKPGTIMLYGPEDIIHYSASPDEWYVNDWIQFKCPESIMKSFALKNNEPFYVGDTFDASKYFYLIGESYFSSNTSKNHVCINLLISLLWSISDLENQQIKQVNHFKELVEIRNLINSHPEFNWSIPQIAADICLSEAYFQELYKTAFGLPCGKDIINSRIIKSQSLLSSTDLKLYEIADMCGYNSDVHFSRQFKKETGFSPIQYRTMNRR